MSRSNILRQLVNFISYLALQVAVAQTIVPPHHALCFIYVGFFLLLPRKRSSLVLQLLVAFVTGLVIDAFYNSLGIHAFATVLMVYSKSYLQRLVLPNTRHEPDARPTLRSMGFKRFSVFVLMLLLIHHTAVFVLDAWDSPVGLLTMRRVALSILSTYLAICFVQSIPTLVVNNR